MNKIRKTKKLPVSIKIVGLILSESYQRCKLFVQKLRKHHSKRFLEPAIKGYLDMDWVEYLDKLRKDIGGQTWAVKKGVVVFLNSVFFGGEDELFAHYSLYVFKNPPEGKVKELAKQEYLNYLNRNNLLYTFFELSMDGEYMGSLLFELRSDLLLKSATWFAMICDPENHLGYSYKNSKIHRVCKRGWFQGGKLGLGNQAGFLEDESFCYKHDRRGILSFANCGKNTNRVQFFVTFKPSEWMDEYYVAFGRVVEGSDVLRRLEYTKCTYEHPNHEIKIENCGLVEVGLGRHMVTKIKIKGLTVGEPHIHLKTFMDLVLDRFCEILFERLDEEIKRNFHREWIGNMIWDEVQPHLLAREPIADVLDENDRSSKVFEISLYLKGLYGLQEIPDHFIMGLLDQIIYDAVEVIDTRDMVRSIVNLIVDNLDLEGVRDEFSAESLMQSIMSNVFNIIFGSDDSKKSETSKRDLFGRSLAKVVSQTPTIRQLLSEYVTHTESVSQYSFLEGNIVEEELFRHDPTNPRTSSSVTSVETVPFDVQERTSTKSIVVRHIWEALFKSFAESTS